MSTPYRFELEIIRDEQNRIHRLVRQLDTRIELISDKLTPAPATALETDPASLPETSPEIVGPVPKAVEPREVEPQEQKGSYWTAWDSQPARTEKTTEQKKASFAATQTTSGVKDPHLPHRSSENTGSHQCQKETVLPAGKAHVADCAVESIEMRLGKFWMARLGIVILITGLVFLGNYAYQIIVPMLGALGKLMLLTFAGGALCGIGLWLERTREAMKNYARVLIAGGAATLYYTAYAAHFVERLRVIESPIAGGLLLLSLAGGIIWFADRRRSEMVALLAVLLSYYTAAINVIGGFSLFSNLLLTGVALYFLLKRQWTKIPIVSLIGTYGSYAFWRMGHAVQNGLDGSFALGIGFLGCYWLLFTVAALRASSTAYRPAERVTFLTLNNAAFAGLGALQFLRFSPQSLWMFAMGYGAALLGVTLIARRSNRAEPSVSGAYYTQGLLMATLGLVSKFSGQQLAIVLAVESALLLGCTRWRYKILNQIGSALCAFAAFAIAVTQIHLPGAEILPGVLVSGLLLFNAGWKKRLDGKLNDPACDTGVLGFSFLGLILSGLMISRFVPPTLQPMVFAFAAIASLFPLRFVRLSEIAFSGQAFLVVGAGLFLNACNHPMPYVWLSPLALIFSAVGLLHWWQKEQILPVSNEVRTMLQAGLSILGVLVGVFWMRRELSGDAWLIATSLAALGTLIYGAMTRAWLIAAAGQLFTLIGVYSLVAGFVVRDPDWAAALFPVANLLITSALVSHARRRENQPPGLLWEVVTQLSTAYRLVATLLVGMWAWEYVKAPLRPLFFAGLGAVRLMIGGQRRDREETRIGLAYTVASLALISFAFGRSMQWPDLLAIFTVLTGWHIHRSLAHQEELSPVVCGDFLKTGALFSLWILVTRWTVQHGAPGQLTIAWGLLAVIVFCAGLGLKERLYRLGGLTVLGLAVGRLFFMDVWGFDPLYRIISFLVLGVVLLSLSFVYNRFADSIRKWL